MALYYYPQIDICVIDDDGFRVSAGGEDVEFFNITQNVSITTITSNSAGHIPPGSLNSASEPVNLLDVVELRHATYTGTARIVLQATAADAAEAVENNNASYILQDTSIANDPDAANVFAQDLGNPEINPVYVGRVRVPGETPLPFAGVDGKTYRIYVARVHRDFDFHAANLEQFSYLDLFVTSTPSGDSPPTFTSATYDSTNSEVDMVFAKNGSATGNIEVEYKLTTASSWTTHATTFAHGAISGSIVITEQPTALTYDIRLKQVGVTGYSTTRQVTVDASGSGGTPPSGLSATETLVASDPDEYDVDLAWTAGSGSGNYTIEKKTSSGGSWSVITSTEAASPYTDASIFATSIGRIFWYRVKQNDVTGYSNEASVYIPRNGG